MTFKITLTVADDELAKVLRTLDLTLNDYDTVVDPQWPDGPDEMSTLLAGKVLGYEPPTITEIGPIPTLSEREPLSKPEVPAAPTWPVTGLGRECPSCGAGPGEGCVTKGGNYAQVMHRGREVAE